jgi:hypothetical protein
MEKCEFLRGHDEQQRKETHTLKREFFEKIRFDRFGTLLDLIKMHLFWLLGVYHRFLTKIDINYRSNDPQSQ